MRTISMVISTASDSVVGQGLRQQRQFPNLDLPARASQPDARTLLFDGHRLSRRIE